MTKYKERLGHTYSFSELPKLHLVII